MARLKALVAVLLSFLFTTPAYAADPVDADGDGYYAEGDATSDEVPAEKEDCADDNVLTHPGAKELIGDAGDADNDCDDIDDATEWEAYVTRLTEKVTDDDARAAKVEAWTAAKDNCVDADTTQEVDGAVWVIGATGPNLCQVLTDDGSRDTRYVWLWPEAELANAPTTAVYRRNAGAAARASKAAEAAQADAGTALVILRGDEDNRGLIAVVGDVSRTVYGVDTDGDGKTDVPGLVTKVSTLEGTIYGIDLDGDGKVDTKGVITRLEALEASNVYMRRIVFGADDREEGSDGLVGSVKRVQTDVNLLARNGVSLYASGLLIVGAQPELSAQVCETYNENFECYEDGTAPRTVRGGGIFGGGIGLGLAYNYEDWRFSVLASQSATIESGDDSSGEQQSYDGSLTRADIGLVHQIGESPWYLGGFVDGYHHESGSTPISTRVTGNGGGAGFMGRYEIPVSGPLEFGVEGFLGLGYTKFGSTVTDPTASWDVLQEGVTLDGGVRVTGGFGPQKR